MPMFHILGLQVSQFDSLLQQLGSDVISDATDPPAPSTGTSTLNYVVSLEP
jgi:hypothetical protein